MPRLNHIEYHFIEEPKGHTRPLYQQVHGNALVEVTHTNLTALYQSPPPADGAYTIEANLRLSVFTADCLPVLFFTDDITGPIAAIHCGWRGANQAIVTHLEDLWDNYPGQIHAILGPCLESCCFEVKEDLMTAFKEKGNLIAPYLSSRDNKTFFSLSSFVIKEQLKFIKPEYIHTADLRCTFCSSPQLPSYRRNKTTDPRISGSISK